MAVKAGLKSTTSTVISETVPPRGRDQMRDRGGGPEEPDDAERDGRCTDDTAGGLHDSDVFPTGDS